MLIASVIPLLLLTDTALRIHLQNAAQHNLVLPSKYDRSIAHSDLCRSAFICSAP